MAEATVTRSSLLSMQVCVPKDWTDEQVERFANTENPTGISSQWHIVRECDELLLGSHERITCESHGGMEHIVLVC